MKKNSRTKRKLKEIRCCICGELIQAEPSGWEFGHNAHPFGTKYDNRCCEQCNYSIVIPTRLELAINQI